MQNHPSRKKTPIAAFRIAAAGLPALAQDAATRPNRPIRRIANFPSSGSVHVIARTVEQKLSEAFNQPVLVDNRTGTRGNIGTAVDGYTLPATPPGPMTVNQNLYKNMPLDPARMAPVVRTSSVPNAITARPDFPFDFVGDPMNHIKANPGKATYGSHGNGSTSHLTGQMFATMFGGDMVHVPFKGDGLALTELQGIATGERSSMVPDWPSAAESVKLPGRYVKFSAQGAEVVGGTPVDMTAFINTNRVRWKRVVDTALVKLS